MAPLTAALLLRAVKHAGAKRGDVIALSAAGGLVARVMSTLLLAEGYVPLGIVRSEQAAAVLARQTPQMDFVSTEQADWAKRIFPVTKGKPIKVALDPVGGKVASALALMLADGGTLVSYGDLSAAPIEVPALSFSTRGISIQGVSVGRWPALPDEVRAADIAMAIQLAQAEPDLFRVAAEYTLDRITDAVTHAERPGKDGAVLLVD
ncbi:zinc-binding dehydrogenase [Duganella sp.]|uniref:zinc-binding dehydrogenase n=1 Tax=Duganella sp. TaxID=1904440 RepID=UPI0031D7D5DD